MTAIRARAPPIMQRKKLKAPPPPPVPVAPKSVPAGSAYFQDQIVDEDMVPIGGAEIWVFVADETHAQASLTDEAGSPVSQPLVSDANGIFHYVALFGSYENEIHYADQLRYIQQVELGTVTAEPPDGNKGDITVSGGGLNWQLNPGAVQTADIADGAVTLAKQSIPPFTSGANGLAPASGGGSTNFLRADGLWTAPPGGGGGLTNGDKGDVVVAGGGSSLTVESAHPAGGSFLVTGVVDASSTIVARNGNIYSDCAPGAAAFFNFSIAGNQTAYLALGGDGATLYFSTPGTFSWQRFNVGTIATLTNTGAFACNGSVIAGGHCEFDCSGGYSNKFTDASGAPGGSINLFGSMGWMEVHVRPGAGQKGVASFTENAVADRWSMGIKPADGNFYFSAGDRALGNVVATLSSAGNLTLAGTIAATNLSGTNTGDQFAALAANSALANNTTGAALPVGIALAANTILGRGASGNIAACTLGATLAFAGAVLGVAAVPNALTLNNGGAGAASGGTFNGSAAVTLSWNTLGACPDTPRIQAAAAESITPTFANDIVQRLACAGAITLNNPTGTAIDGWGLVVRLRDNGTARAIGYGTQYRAVGVTLPVTTVISKMLILGFIFNNTDTKWDLVAVAQE